MFDQTKEIIDTILLNPKIGYSAALLNQVSISWNDWGSLLVDVISSFAGFVLVCLLIWRNVLSLKKEILSKD